SGLTNALLLVLLRRKLFSAAEKLPPPQGRLCAIPPLNVIVSVTAAPPTPSWVWLEGRIVEDCGPTVDVSVGLYTDFTLSTAMSLICGLRRWTAMPGLTCRRDFTSC